MQIYCIYVYAAYLRVSLPGTKHTIPPELAANEFNKLAFQTIKAVFDADGAEKTMAVPMSPIIQGYPRVAKVRNVWNHNLNPIERMITFAFSVKHHRITQLLRKFPVLLVRFTLWVCHLRTSQLPARQRSPCLMIHGHFAAIRLKREYFQPLHKNTGDFSIPCQGWNRTNDTNACNIL